MTGGVGTYKLIILDSVKDLIKLTDNFRESSVVHLHTPHEALKYFWRTVFFYKKKIVYTPHSFPTFFYKKNDCISFVKYSLIELFLFLFHLIFLLRCKKCICLSQYEYRIWTKYFPLMRNKFEVIPTAIKPRQKQYNKTTRNLILWIGSFDARKKPFEFLDFIRKINSLIPSNNFKFIMCGNGPLFNDICSYAKNDENFRNLEINKNLDNNKILNLFTRGKYLVSFSVQEGLPMTFLEALEYGVRIITTAYKGGDVHEFLNQSNSIIIKNRDDYMDQLYSVNLDFSEDVSHLKQPYNFQYFIERYLCIYESK